MDTVQLTALVGTVASLVSTLVVGALTFFLKKTLTSLEKADEKNAAKIAEVEEKLNDLKSDLPLLYVTREDYIRVMNRVEEKLDKILYSRERKEE